MQESSKVDYLKFGLKYAKRFYTLNQIITCLLTAHMTSTSFLITKSKCWYRTMLHKLNYSHFE